VLAGVEHALVTVDLLVAGRVLRIRALRAGVDARDVSLGVLVGVELATAVAAEAARAAL
jgi:hypothetical protein